MSGNRSDGSPLDAAQAMPGDDEVRKTGKFSGSTYAARQIKRTHVLPEAFMTDTEENNAVVAEFLRKQFPMAQKYKPHCGCHRCMYQQLKLDLNCYCRPCRDSRNAAAWMNVIQRFYRLGWADGDIENEYGWNEGEVGSICQKIRRAIAGQRLDGLPRTGRPRGRPKMAPKSLSGIMPSSA
jgi:hypothetical protein